MSAEKFNEEQVRPDELSWLSRNFRLKDEPCFTVNEILGGLPGLRMMKIPGHTAIIREGELGRDLYVVYEGDVSVNKNKGMFCSVEVARLRPGSYFGEIAYFGRGVRKATVTAESPTKVFRIPAEDLKELLEKKQAASETMQADMAGRIEKLKEIDSADIPGCY